MEILSVVSRRIGDLVQLETVGEQHGTRKRAFLLLKFPGTDRQYSVADMLRAHFNTLADQGEHVGALPQILSIGVTRYTADGELIPTSLDQPLEIDMRGIVPGGEEIRYRLVGVVRQIGQSFVTDYLDTDRNEWIYTKDSQFHVINGRPRNGGADPCFVFYERI
jgi:hypothetical protein